VSLEDVCEEAEKAGQAALVRDGGIKGNRKEGRREVK
jgi:hypothetical protein